MFVAFQRDRGRTRDRLMIMDDGKRPDAHDLPYQIRLMRNPEWPDCFVFFTHIYFFLLKLFCFLTHALGYHTHLPALVRKGIGFVFFLLDLFGKLRILAVASTQRSALMPDVPSISESGVPGFQVEGALGFFVPAATPRPLR